MRSSSDSVGVAAGNNTNTNNTSSSATTTSSGRRLAHIKLTTINEHFQCGICYGYITDATTITECLHSCKWERWFERNDWWMSWITQWGIKNQPTFIIFFSFIALFMFLYDEAVYILDYIFSSFDLSEELIEFYDSRKMLL